MTTSEIADESVLECLSGAIDMHVHSAPDIIERSGNDIDFALQAKGSGMRGFVLKSHYVPTTDRATLTNHFVSGIKVFGGLSLNNSVGGMNPLAVEVAGRSGAKVIWLPTVDSENEAGKRNLPEMLHPPPWARMQKELVAEGFKMDPVKLFKNNGDFTDEVLNVIHIIKKYKMTLATGHISPKESTKIIKLAREEGIERIVVTHPEFPSTNFTIQEQVDLKKLGVFFERCYSMPATSKTTWDYMIKEVLATGFENNIIATDLGQKGAISPVAGMKASAQMFLKSGISKENVRVMMVDNPKFLIG